MGTGIVALSYHHPPRRPYHPSVSGKPTSTEVQTAVVILVKSGVRAILDYSPI